MEKIKFLMILALFAVLFVACKPQPFTGYVVCKEYIPAHMDNEEPERQTYAAIYHHYPQLIESAWKLYVANKYEVRIYDVDTLTFVKTKVGIKITTKSQNWERQ